MWDFLYLTGLINLNVLPSLFTFCLCIAASWSFFYIYWVVEENCTSVWFSLMIYWNKTKNKADFAVMANSSWGEKMPWCCGIAGQLECTEKLSCTPRFQGGTTELLFSSLLFIQHAIFMDQKQSPYHPQLPDSYCAMLTTGTSLKSTI